MGLSLVKIKGFLLNQNPIFFDGNAEIFKNSPTIKIEKLWSMCNKNFSDVANKNYPEVIQSVFSKYKVKEQTRSLESTGRILEFDISCSMYDCLAYEETNGFFDECDCPPPEFWIAYIDDKLFAYIPKEHLDIANLGVEISMSGSLQWVQTLVD